MEKEQFVGYEIHTLDNMFGRCIALLAEKHGITFMQGWIIQYLYEHPEEEVFQKDLEAFFHIARSTATGILQLMEKRGFLHREPVAHDARLKRLILSEKGRQQELTILQSLQELEIAFQKDIPPEKLAIFFEVIQQMKNNISANSLFSKLPQDCSCIPPSDPDKAKEECPRNPHADIPDSQKEHLPDIHSDMLSN